MGFAPSALANCYFLANHILLAQIYPPNSIFLKSPMVLSNALTPPPRHFVPHFRTFGTSIVWAPLLIFGEFDPSLYLSLIPCSRPLRRFHPLVRVPRAARQMSLSGTRKK